MKGEGLGGEVVLGGMVEDGSDFLPDFLTTDSGMTPCPRLPRSP